MSRALTNLAGATTSTWLKALDRDALVGERLVDHEIVRREAMIDFGIRDGRAQHELDVLGHSTWREQELLARVDHRTTANVLEHEANLACGRADVTRLGADQSGVRIAEALISHLSRASTACRTHGHGRFA